MQRCGSIAVFEATTPVGYMLAVGQRCAIPAASVPLFADLPYPSVRESHRLGQRRRRSTFGASRPPLLLWSRVTVAAGDRSHVWCL